MRFLPFLLKRIARHWQIFLTVSLGVLLATALLAGAPLLIDTIIDFGLHRSLASSDPLTSNLLLTAHVPAGVEPEAVAELDAQVQRQVTQALGDAVDRFVLSTGSYWLYPWSDEGLERDQRVNLLTYEEIAERATFVAGGWPEQAVVAEDVVAGVIAESFASTYGLRVRDRLPVSFKRKGDLPDAWIEVAGIIRSENPRDPYWFGAYGPLTAESTQRWTAQYNVLLPEEDFFTAVDLWFPRSELEVRWHVLLLTEQRSTRVLGDLAGEIRKLRTEIKRGDPSVLLKTDLDALLDKFESQATVLRTPLYILTAEIVLLTLYYVVMTAALAVRQVEGEFAALGSRGAAPRQLLAIQITEAILIALVALASGPLLGGLLIRGLAWFGPLSDVNYPGWQLEITRSAWIAAGAGAVLSILSLILPVRSALERSVVAHQRDAARRLTPPWWQRAYLDVFVLIAGMLFLWRVDIHGGVAAGTAGSEVDWILLLSPLALLLGSATVLLRLFPLILSALAALAGRGRGLTGPLALWQAARYPAHVARLVLLLTLATSLGILSTGLNATLDLSEEERAAYFTGSDVRLSYPVGEPGTMLQEHPYIRRLSKLWRGRASAKLPNYPHFKVLGVSPEEIEEMISYRDDFAPGSLPALLDQLERGEGESNLELPGRPENFGLWLSTPPDDRLTEPYGQVRPYAGHSNLDRVALMAKFRTARGEYFTTELQVRSGAGCPLDCWYGSGCRPKNAPWSDPQSFTRCDWGYFYTVLPNLPEEHYPLALHSLWFRHQIYYKARSGISRPSGVQIMPMLLDDLTVVDRESGEIAIVESFEDFGQGVWKIDDTRSGLRYKTNCGHSGDGCQSLTFLFDGVTHFVNFYLYSVGNYESLPVVASADFMEKTNLEVGDVFNAWIGWLSEIPCRLVGEVNYFPTMFDERLSDETVANSGYVVTNRDALIQKLNIRAPRSVNVNELWADTDGTLILNELDEIAVGATEVWERERVRQDIKAHPMALGLRSVTFFGAVMTGLLSLVGFATYFYMSARQRATMYGILRSMGMAPLQLYGSLVVEQVILIFFGIAFGTGLGVLLNRLILPGLPISLGDRPPVPPFVPVEDWAAVGRINLLLVGTFLLTLGFATYLLWRSRLHQMLRIGQE